MTIFNSYVDLPEDNTYDTHMTNTFHEVYKPTNRTGSTVNIDGAELLRWLIHVDTVTVYNIILSDYIILYHYML